MTPVFKHSGKLGDIIWSLPFISQMGGGDLYLEIGLLDGGLPRITRDSYEALRPLLEMQDYIRTVAIYTGEAVDFDLDRFRAVVPEANCNLVDSYFLAHGVPVDPRNHVDPWLNLEYLAPVTRKRIVVSRTGRYLRNTPSKNPFYRTLVRQGLGDQGVFIGFEEEHRAFQEQYEVKIEHLQTRSIADIAAAVKASDLCVSNENLVGALAEGFKKTAVREIDKGGPETLYCVFKRANLFYI